MPEARIIIAGGGTGGHIFPAISIADAIRTRMPEADILFVGANHKMEMQKVPEAGYPIEGLDITGFDRRSLFRNLSLPLRLVKSFLAVRGIFKRFRPHAVIGVGGYSSFPVLRYAQAVSIPTFIHESNAFAGKSNMLLGRKANRIFVAAAGMEKFFPKASIHVTGNPVRRNILEPGIPREACVAYFGLDPAKTTILSMGGSLGAKSINEAMADGLSSLLQAGIQLIWQTGRDFALKAQALTEGMPGIWTGPFIKDMHYAYAAADLVISRAGAMSVAEISAIGKAAVYVPYPLAAEDHQTVNASVMVSKGAACLVADKDARGQLVGTALMLAQDQERCKKMGEAAKGMSLPDAAGSIAAIVLSDIQTSQKG